MTNIDERIAKAVTALRAAGHSVVAEPGVINVYRVDGGAAVTGLVVLALAIRLSLMDTLDRRG